MSECRLSPLPSGEPRKLPRHEFNELVSAEDGISTLAQATLRAYARPAEEGAARRDHWARNYRADDVYPAWAQELRELCVSGRRIGPQIPRRQIAGKTTGYVLDRQPVLDHIVHDCP